jgi:carbamoylphosphate synthase large subunit
MMGRGEIGMSQLGAKTFLVIMAATHGLYGEAFLRELKRAGHRVVVVTRAEALGYEWPRALIDDLFAVPDIFNAQELENAATYLAREVAFDRIVGPGEYDIELAARLREHFRLPGLGDSAARLVRDKLAMRDCAHRHGVLVPQFLAALHLPAIARFLESVPGPWIIKPRMAASSKGITVCHDKESVWRTVHGLGDRLSHHLIEKFTPGDIYHLDGVVLNGEVCFASAHRYGRPILDLHTHGGVYTTWRIQTGSPEEIALQALNQRVIQALGLAEGVFHIEYIHDRETGQFYFLEASARVGAGLIEDMVEAESGLNLWACWARIEMGDRTPPPPDKNVYAGVLASAAAVERPDARPFENEHVRAVPAKPYHLGLLVSDASADAVSQRLESLAAAVAQQVMVHF